MKKTLLQFFLIPLALIFSTHSANASHVMAVDMTYTCIGNGQYVFTLIMYRDCEGITPGTTVSLNFSSASCSQNFNATLQQIGTSQEVSALCPSELPNSSCSGGALPGTEQWIYQDTITFPANCPDWTISWGLCCRNGNITNLTTPTTWDTYIEATLDNTGGLCNSSPQFSSNPVPYICAGQPFCFNHGAFDPDGDSLAYALAQPLDAAGVPIAYTAGYSITQPVLTTGPFNFNPVTGEMCFTPNGVQTCVIAVEIEEWRNGVLIATHIRELQVVVYNCTNQQPNDAGPGIQALTGGPSVTAVGSNDITMCPGDNVCFNMLWTDPDGDNVTVNDNVALAIPGATFNTPNNGNSPNLTSTFCWTPTALDTGLNVFTVGIVDDGCPILGGNFYTFSIYVWDETFAGPDQYYCPGGVAPTLDAVGGNTFTWSVISGDPMVVGTNFSCNPCSNPVATPAITTTYEVLSDLAGSCKNRDTVTVFVVPTFPMTVTPLNSTICLNEIVQLNVSTPDVTQGPYTYSWTPATGLSSTSSANPTASPSVSTTYTVTVTSNNGCIQQETVQINVSGVGPLVVLSDTTICPGESVNITPQIGVPPALCGPNTTGCTGTTSFNDIGANTTTSTIYGPFYGSNTLNYAKRHQYLFTAAELQGMGYLAGGSIEEIGFYITTTNANSHFDFTIKIGCTNMVEFPNTSYVGGLDQVHYVANYTTPGVAGWNMINLQTPYWWDGTSNIIIEVCSSGSSGLSETCRYTTTTPVYKTIYDYSTVGLGCNEPTGTRTFLRPNMRFGICEQMPTAPTYTWSPTAGLSNPNILNPVATPAATTTYQLDVVDGGSGCTGSGTMTITIDSTNWVVASPDTTICSGDVQLNATVFGPPPPGNLQCGTNNTPLSPTYIQQVGNGTASSSTYGPFFGSYEDVKYQFLYYATDLQAAGITSGTFTQIAWNIINKLSTGPFQNYRIGMGCTNATSLVAANGWLPVQNVWGPANYTSVAGWNTFTLANTFDWDGVSNIVIEVCWDQPDLVTIGADQVQYTNVVGYDATMRYYSNTISPGCNLAATYDYTYYPNCRFTVSPPPPATWSYVWSPTTGLSDPNILNPLATPPGPINYVVTVTGPPGTCPMTDTVTIAYSSSTPPGVAVTDVSCFGANDGQFVITGAGVAPFQHSIDNGVTFQGSNTFNGLAPGTYDIVVTDALGCTSTTQATITEPPLLTATATPTAETCDGACDGALTGGAGGGTPPYTYSWDNGAGAGQNHTNQCDGSYTLTVTDANGCTATATAVINPGLLVTANFTYNGNQCLTGNSFDFTDLSTNATGWNWNFGASATPTTSTAQNPTGVTFSAPGTYPVTLTASNGACNGNVVINVTVYPEPTVTAGGTDASCLGVCDGTLTANGSGGTGALSYSWDNGPTTANQTNVCAGTYTVTVTDVNGCSAQATFTINEPTALTATATATDASCFGLCDGTLSGNGAGGTPPYSYSWDGGVGAGQNPTGVCAGTYTVTVTDANGCTATATATINEPTALTASATSTDASCFGVCDGTLSGNGAGGTPPYSYTWDNGVGAGQNPTGICAGTYTVTVTDANGCTATANTTVNEPTQLSVTASGTNVDCNGNCNGTVAANPAGGTPPYSYAWDNGAGTNATASGLCANTYTVTVTDANGCTATASYTVTEPLALTAAIAGVDATCSGVCDGSATVTPADGTPPYTYQWDAGGGFATTATATGLCAGTANVTVTDANNCTFIIGITINEPAAIVLTTSTTPATCGNPDGQACVTIAGGTPPYTQVWDDPGAQTTLCANGILAGSYTVTVTDANGCVMTASATVNDAGAPTATITASTDVSCFGGNNGSATVTAAGGTPPYTYAWTPSGGTAATATGLTAGNYCVDVTDVNGCVASACITINEPPLLTGAITASTDPSCDGACDGSGTVSASGGVPPYTYLWSSGGTGTTESGLCAGAHTVTITDANGCAIIVPLNLTDPPALTGTIVGTDATCDGLCDGLGDLTPGGGTPPYTFLWSNTQTTEDASGLCAGNHSVTITDANGCTLVANVTINEPTAVATSTTVTDASCGQSDGGACVTASGGTPPYTYLWNDAGVQTTACATNLPAGAYSVTVTDANGCTAIANVTVNDLAGPTAVASVVADASGAGLCDGSTTVTPSGGTPPYTYLWDDPGAQTTQTATGLCAGTYCVTVTDANGCTTTECVTVVEPPAMIVTIVGTNLLCNGVCNGATDVTVVGGVAPYTYVWDHGPTAEDLTGLCAGAYGVTVTDANGVNVYETITITEPPLLSITAANGFALLCNGDCNGTLDVTATGGTAPLTYDWVDDATSLSVGTTANVTGMCVGSYTVTVTDANGCTATQTVAITEPTALVLVTSATDANCGQTDGQACVAISGGTGPYTQLWDDGAAQTTLCANNVGGGVYNVVVTDANGCTATASVTVNDNGGGVATATVDNHVSCAGVCDGQATVAIAGGTAPYTYSWNSGATTATATGLCAGSHIVTVTDANGCTAVDSVTITEPVSLTITTNITDVTCNGACDGAVATTINGGTGPFTYLWDDPGTSTTQNVSNLCAGTYTVTVTDFNGCTVSATVTVGEPTALSLFPSSIDANCGQADGSVTVLVSDGSGTYVSYVWTDSGGNTVGTTITVNGLPSGIYDVTVTDSDGCIGTASIAVGDLAGPTTTLVSSVDVSCFGGNDGTAEVNATGGVGPYTYLWTGGATPNAATNSGLAAGSYSVLVTDANGCTDNMVVNINEPTAVVASIAASVDASGAGICDGSATAAGAGGTPGYTYAWWDATYTTSAGTNATANGLCVGTYCCIITDMAGCVDTVCVTISEPNAITTVLSANDVTCNGLCDGSASVTVAGGVPPYTVQWYQGPIPGTIMGGVTGLSATNLCPGVYYVIVTDANGVVFTSEITTVNEPAAITATTNVLSNYNGQDVSCNGACDGSADVQPVGGTPPYTYEWFDATNFPLGQQTQVATSLCAGTYTVEVTDANNCLATFTVTITEPAPLTNAFTNVNVSCNGACDGQSTATPAGGTPPYTYLWTTPGLDVTASVTGQCAGTYNVTITDANGCSITETTTITEPIALVLGSTSAGSNCGQADGSATVTIVQGVAPYTYQWDAAAGNQTTATATALTSGCYNVTVTDANGCTEVLNVCVTDLGAPTVSILTQTDVSCNGACDGFAQISVAGGTAPYTYAWYDDLGAPIGQTTASAFNLCAGTYVGEMTDANGCVATVSVTINEPTALNAVMSNETDVTCFGYCDGSATVTTSGGTVPYAYLWNDPGGQTGATATNLCPGAYTVTVTDANGCIITANALIGEPADIVLTTSTVDAFCGTATGSATVTITNGTGPYQILWTPGNISGNTANGIVPGVYTVSVIDANGCSQTATATVGDIPPGIATIGTTTNVSCNGGTDGSATVSMGGTGMAPYTYEWYNGLGIPLGQNGITAFGLPAGDYYCVVTDVNGCVSTSNTITITEPTLLGITMLPFDATCNGACDGEAQATVGGGTPPYTFLWDDPLAQNTANAAGLCAGTYNLLVTDANGCTLSEQAIIGEPTIVDLDSTVVNANCGQADGQACVIATGGTPPYSYLWPDNSTNSCNVGLAAGTYCVDVTDANLCTYTICVEIQDIAGPSAAIVAQTEVSCNGLSDGSATVDMVGGTGLFTVQWDAAAGNQTTPTASGLAAGTYTVIITDAVGCSASTSVTITEPTPLSFTTGQIDPTCFAGCDGEAGAAVAGGTPPYTYNWLDGANNPIGQTGDTATGLCADNYTLTITDANGCIAIVNYVLVDPPLVTGTTTVVNVNCFGACDGQATATGGVGIPPFTYLWDAAAGSQTTATATGLCPGTYTCTITDADGCFATVTATITEPPLLTAAINNFGDVSCNGACDGFAQVDVAGGTAPFSYNWSNGGISQVNSNLCAGTYDVTVTDALGCQATATVTITEPQGLSISITTVDVDCYQACNGSVTANVSGGTAPYSFLWDDPNFSTTAMVTNLCAGTYNVVVTDVNGCSFTASAFVTEPTLLGMNVTTTDANCGNNNGQACVSVIGGTGPYTYQWNDPFTQTTSCADNLTAGCYTVTITDGNGCFVDSLICINDISGPTITTVNVSDVTCNGMANGVVEFNATGGTGALTYEWWLGNTLLPHSGALASGLSGGCYTLIVTDAAGCIATSTECVFEPAVMNSAITFSQDVSCNLGSDGQATVSANGGIPPYTYSWNGGTTPNQSNNSGFAAGTYSVTVTDVNGCTTTSTVTINQPAAIGIALVGSVDASCNGAADGSLDVGVSGGTAPYLYSWSGGAGSGPSATNLASGTYTVTVTDANGCVETATYNVAEPDVLVVSGVTVDATCSDCNGEGTISAAGGTAPYNFLWQTGASPNNAMNTALCPGDHDVVVTDNQGCIANITVTVNDQPSPQIDSMTFVSPLCNGLTNGSATVYASGGTGNYTYLWDAAANNQVAQTAVGLGAGVFCVTVSDANGCTASQCVNVTEPSVLNAVPDLDATICYGDSAPIWASGQGGVAPYVITWQNAGMSGTGPIIVAPTQTTDYCFTVTDANGCFSPQGCVTITVTPALDLDLTPDQDICIGDDIQLTATGTGGNGDPYTFEWHEGGYPGTIINTETGVTTSNTTVSPTVDTWYYVLLDDGCSTPVLDSVQVTLNATPIGFLNVVDSAGCVPFTAQFTANSDIGVTYDWDFDCDGIVDLSGTNSAPTWTYDTPGLYDVCLTITSADGCVLTLQQAGLVEAYPVPVADFSMTPNPTTAINPTVTFTDLSVGGSWYQWDFGDGTVISGSDSTLIQDGSIEFPITDPVHTYLDTGMFTITLTIANAYGCSSTVSYELHVAGDYILFAPNAFTPNNDGKNDIFYAYGVGLERDGFEMFIFDRWGEIVFESHNVNNGWDGTIKGTGVLGKTDVYVWLIRAKDEKGNDHEYLGHVTLLR